RRIQRDRSLEFALALIERKGLCETEAERGVRFGERAVEGEGPVRVDARSRQRIGRRHSLVEGKKRCGSRSSGERLRERRIQLHGVVEVTERWSKLALVEEIAPAEVEIVRRLTRRPARFGDRDRLHTGCSPTPAADSAAERRREL